jgi:superfamily II DNA helicase RecQ
MLFLLPVKLIDRDDGLITVVIVPLVALQANLLTRTRADGIKSSCWTSQNNNPDSPIVFVSVEAAATNLFHQWLRGLCTRRILARIVVDEVHRAIGDQNYRDVFNHLGPIRTAAKVPLVLLTATIPPSCEQLLMRKFGCSLFETVRNPTNRLNISYSFHSISRSKYAYSIGTYLVQQVQNMDQHYRAIVFCRTKTNPHDGVESIADYISLALTNSGIEALVSRYYSDKEAKEDEYAQWQRGDAKVMVATTALGAGIHIESIRDVIHCGLSNSMVDYAQETGRGGRDGQLCNAITYYDPSSSNKPPPLDQDFFGARALADLAANNVKCRRFDLMDLLDGIPSDCIACCGQLCDNCAAQYNLKPTLIPIRINEMRANFPQPEKQMDRPASVPKDIRDLGTETRGSNKRKEMVCVHKYLLGLTSVLNLKLRQLHHRLHYHLPI